MISARSAYYRISHVKNPTAAGQKHFFLAILNPK